MFVTITMNGTTPLLHHDSKLANPDDTFAKQISAISKKRTKTEEDRQAMAKLEWFGGMWVAPGIVDGPAMKCAAVRLSCIDAAKPTRKGTAMGRALTLTEQFVPLEYDGPRDMTKLWEIEKFRDYRPAGVNNGLIMRMRPCFFPWSATLRMFVTPAILDVDELVSYIKLAGITEGVGDYRGGGFGRFSATVLTSE